MTRKSLSAALALLLLVSVKSDAPACGPAFPEAVFTWASYPNDPAYGTGQLGILAPTFWRKFLVAAYLRMSGRTPVRAAAAAAAAAPAPAPVPAAPAAEPVSALNEWVAARKKTAPALPDPAIDQDRSDPKTFSYYFNCNDNAFRNATATLRDRAAKFAAGSPALASWIAAQDTVFSNCKAGKSIPADAEASLPPLIRADRAYQVAAAHFYAESYAEAHARFRAIAADSASPWQPVAPYLAARALIRAATVGNDKTALPRADAELAAIAKDPRQAAWHKAAADLRQWVALRMRPAEALAELDARLNAPGPGFEDQLTDYTYLMDRYSEGWNQQRDPGDMTRWIVNFQSTAPEAAAQAVARWREKRSLPWLVAALAKAGPRSPAARELLTAAAAVTADSPAYATVFHHRIRLRQALGETDAARRELDAALPEFRKRQPLAALNAVLAQRFALARGIDEFARFGPRMPVAAMLYDERDAEVPQKAEPLLDNDATALLNRGLPQSALLAVVENPAFPAPLAARVAQAGFVRAVVLDDHAAAQRFAARAQAALYRDPFDAVYYLLENPGLRLLAESGLPVREDQPRAEIDSFRANWWCAADPKATPAPPAFLTAAERAQFEKEWAVLGKVAAGPTWLGRRAIEWARAHPDDPRSPKALYLTVRATRYGCGDDANGATSKTAFDLLRRSFPQSEWTRKTPYWYN